MADESRGSLLIDRNFICVTMNHLVYNYYIPNNEIQGILPPINGDHWPFVENPHGQSFRKASKSPETSALSEVSTLSK